MSDHDGYKGERVHLECPKGVRRKSRKHGYAFGGVTVGDKQSIYIKKDGQMKTIGKICLNCGKVWLKDEYKGFNSEIEKLDLETRD